MDTDKAAADVFSHRNGGGGDGTAFVFQIGKGACGIGDQMAAAERALITELDGILRCHGRVECGVMFQNFGHWYVLFLIGLCSNDIIFFSL